MELAASSGITVTSARTQPDEAALVHPAHLLIVNFATVSPGLEQSVSETLSPPSEGEGDGLSLDRVTPAEGTQRHEQERTAERDGAETRRCWCLHPGAVAPQQQHSDRPCRCSWRAYF